MMSKIDEDREFLTVDRDESQSSQNEEPRFPGSPRIQRPDKDASFSTYMKLWWLENLGAFLILMCLLAIVLALALFQGRALDQWPYRISINTVIAVFAAIMTGIVRVLLLEGTNSHLGFYSKVTEIC